jgi:ABC-type branched-subunit amino acid transport system ATPase component
MTPSDLVKRGVIQVMEGPALLRPPDRIEENLLTGAYTRSDRPRG